MFDFSGNRLGKVMKGGEVRAYLSPPIIAFMWKSLLGKPLANKSHSCEEFRKLDKNEGTAELVFVKRKRKIIVVFHALNPLIPPTMISRSTSTSVALKAK